MFWHSWLNPFWCVLYMTNVYICLPKNPVISKTHRKKKNHTSVTHMHFFSNNATLITHTIHIGTLSRIPHLKTYSQDLLWMARYGNFIIENSAHAALSTHQTRESHPPSLCSLFLVTMICEGKKPQKQLLNITWQFWNVGKYKAKPLWR